MQFIQERKVGALVQKAFRRLYPCPSLVVIPSSQLIAHNQFCLLVHLHILFSKPQCFVPNSRWSRIHRNSMNTRDEDLDVATSCQLEKLFCGHLHILSCTTYFAMDVLSAQQSTDDPIGLTIPPTSCCRMFPYTPPRPLLSMIPCR